MPSSLSMRREFSSLEYCVTACLPTLCYSYGGGSLDYVCGVQTHSGPLFLVLFCKDVVRMNGMPQPNLK